MGPDEVKERLAHLVGRRGLLNDLVLQQGMLHPEQLQEYRDNIYRNMFDRTPLLFDRRDFRDLKETYQHIGREVRIACISPDLRVSRDVTSSAQDFDLIIRQQRDGCDIFAAGARVSPAQWIEDRLRELDHALEKQPHIVCFSELCYPPPAASTFSWSVENMQESAVDRERFNQMVRERTNKHMERFPAAPRPFIFLGSYHCPLTLYNVGIILPTGSNETRLSFRVTREMYGDKEPRVHNDETKAPIYYRKRFPARRAGERTRVPPTHEFDIFHMPFGCVGVIICSDILDLNQFYKIAAINRRGSEPIDFILVPSMNGSDMQVSLCRELSHLANTTVAAVNISSDKLSLPLTSVFCCGFDAAQIAELATHNADIENAIGADPPVSIEREGRRTGELRVFRVSHAPSSALRRQYRPPDIPGLSTRNLTEADAGDIRPAAD